jgi:DNA invertase Pin-like site-specific DNA recombinase
MTVYGYTRVSTERQADEGESLDVQQRQIGGYAMMKGLEIGRVFVERGVSGSERTAPGRRTAGGTGARRRGRDRQAGPHVPLRP